jgi:hypothetical protein
MAKLFVGEIPVFPFPEPSPVELRRHPEEDMFLVYDGNGNPKLCSWVDNAFWYRWGETDADWEVVLNVQYWFRVPTVTEVADRQIQTEGGTG